MIVLRLSPYATREEAIKAIRNCKVKPTIVNHSGGGFHCYWVLNQQANTSDIGVKRLESVNKALLEMLKGDAGTQNINRVFRVPGTYNFKLAGNPREVKVVYDNGPKYDLKELLNFCEKPKPTATKAKASGNQSPSTHSNNWDQKISSLPVSDRIKYLIINGNDGTYPSRSEADMAVILALVSKGIGESDIRSIFASYAIGAKYREHSSPDEYLSHCIENAREFDNLTDDERQDPLFISGALHKDDKKKYHLKIVKFQEYMSKKHMLKFLEKEQACFRYTGKCYEQCSNDRLNNLCQTELGKHRELFGPSTKNSFIHYAIGDDLVEIEDSYEAQVRYLTMQNGLYDLSNYELIPHDPGIFTTNLLPYDFDPDADCPRWMQYLDEVFTSDQATIQFVQEAVGYIFQKSIPKAAVFFLVGDGGNGKSVFIDIISSLCGKENVSNISLNKLNDEKYLPELFGKMINVSGETPKAKFMNTDLIKAVTAGDWVTGREVFKNPWKFRPIAKHFLGMNTLPDIDDNTDGMWRRIYVIEFPRKFSEKEMDVELTDKLIKELSGIFNWALEGYRRLRDQDYIFSDSLSMEKSKKRYKQKNSSVIDFVESHLPEILVSKPSVPFKDVYANYREFCSSEGINRVFSKKDFRSFKMTSHRLSPSVMRA